MVMDPISIFACRQSLGRTSLYPNTPRAESIAVVNGGLVVDTGITENSYMPFL